MDLLEVPEHALEQRHPWELARFEFFLQVLARNIDLRALRTVLDVGAGDAWFAAQLAARVPIARIVCWDNGYTPEFVASRRPGEDPRVQLALDRPAGRFDLLLLMDVLEHVADDTGLLGSLVRDNVTTDGWVLISVPAWPSLFSSHDVRLRHERRYTPAAGRRLLSGAGLEIAASAGLFHSLLLPRAALVARERLTGASKPPADAGAWNAPPLVTRVVRSLLALDGRLSLTEARLGWTLPGLSWWALCRRTSH
jgi:SAM-dependent methyltransferase